MQRRKRRERYQGYSDEEIRALIAEKRKNLEDWLKYPEADQNSRLNFIHVSTDAGQDDAPRSL